MTPMNQIELNMSDQEADEEESRSSSRFTNTSSSNTDSNSSSNGEEESMSGDISFKVMYKMKGDTYIDSNEAGMGEDTNDDRVLIECAERRRQRQQRRHRRAELKLQASASFLKNKDLKNILFLMFLYLLQGVPLGLTGSLPFIMGSRNVSYSDQGTFSFAFWPFSLKLLWAPIVDSLFFKRIGRRKSWLVPMQYLIGIFLYAFSSYVHVLLEGDTIHDTVSLSFISTNSSTSLLTNASETVTQLSTSKDIYMLTLIFFMFTFMAATQDIAVDGWGLTMLSKENTAWTSTCNSVGQTTGWFIGNVIFLVFESHNFCNKYVRPIFGLESQTYGLVTIDKFMKFFGIVFVVSTTLVLLFKKETISSESSTPTTTRTKPFKYETLLADHDNSTSTSSILPINKPEQLVNKQSERNHKRRNKLKIDEHNMSLRESYTILLKIFKLPSVLKLAFVLLTYKVAFATNALGYLKLIDKGVPKENLGLLAVPLTPLEIILPILVTRYTNGPKPLHYFIKALPFRILTLLLIALFIYITPSFRDENTNAYPFYFYLLCILMNGLNTLTNSFCSLSTISFFTRISDKRIGGTYMTLLNTISNIGSSWPSTLSFYLVDLLTRKQCSYDPASIVAFNRNATLNFGAHGQPNSLSRLLDEIDKNKCQTTALSKECVRLGGSCETLIDAYYLITCMCALIGIAWILTYKKLVYRLQACPKSSWKIK